MEHSITQQHLLDFNFSFLQTYIYSDFGIQYLQKKLSHNKHFFKAFLPHTLKL